MKLHRDPYDGRDHPQWYVTSVSVLAGITFVTTVTLLYFGI